MNLIFRDRYEVLLVNAGPVNQVPLVNLESSIEAGVEDRGQRDHISGKGVLFAGDGEAQPDDNLGRTKIDVTRWYFDLLLPEE